jgi:hypothetical protein
VVGVCQHCNGHCFHKSRGISWLAEGLLTSYKVSDVWVSSFFCFRTAYRFITYITLRASRRRISRLLWSLVVMWILLLGSGSVEAYIFPRPVLSPFSSRCDSLTSFRSTDCLSSICGELENRICIDRDFWQRSTGDWSKLRIEDLLNFTSRQSVRLSHQERETQGTCGMHRGRACRILIGLRQAVDGSLSWWYEGTAMLMWR